MWLDSLQERQAPVQREQYEVLDSVQDAALVCELTGTILFWNQGAEARYGWSKSEALGHRSHNLLRTEFPRPVEEVYAHLLRDGHWTGELVHTRRDGIQLVVDSRWTLQKDEMGRPVSVLEINSDITRRKATEQALRESEERYRQMFERNRAIKLLINPVTGEVVDANPAACDFYGYSLEALQKMKIWQLNVLAEREVRAKLDIAMQGQESYFVFRHRLASGEVRDVEVSASPIDIQGRQLLYSIVHDITERKQAERALWHYTKRLQILHDIDQAVLALKSPEEIGQAALHHLRQVIPARLASVVLFDFSSMKARVLAIDGAGPTDMRPGEQLPLNSAWAPPDQWRKNVYLIDDLATSTETLPGMEVLRAGGIRAHLSMPLVAQGQLLGVLNLGSGKPNAFTLQHLDIARQVADSLAVAIQNAQLYEREQRARETAETLRAANIALTQSLDVDAVYDTLFDHLGRLVAYDSASVLLATEDNEVAMRAYRGYEQWADPSVVQTLKSLTFGIDTTPTIAAVMRRQQSLVIPDTAEFQGWRPLPASEHVRNWLGVPLIAHGRCIGLCSIDKAEVGFFSADHLRLAEALAAQAAVAILNARLYEEVRAGRLQLQTLSRRLVDVQERERRHVARELHDEAGQALTSLMVGLGLLERETDLPGPVVEQLDNLKHVVDQVLENLHGLAVNLRPASLDHLGLIPALRQYLDSVQRQNGVSISFETFGLEGQRLNPEAETSLYRIVQEAITNIIRHATATQAGVLVERQGDRVVAIIEDNGWGFDAEDAMQHGSLGLLGMRERAEMLDGKLAIESTPGHGTSVFVNIPFVPMPGERRNGTAW